MSEPKRIQRKRTKGWKMPANTVYVGRPTLFGNPYRIVPPGSPAAEVMGEPTSAEEAVEEYRGYVKLALRVSSTRFGAALVALRGKDLACWCPLDQPCHADVLLELANQ